MPGSEFSLGGSGGLVTAVLFAELGLALVIILLRGYTRHFIKGGLAADDYALWVTWVLQAGFSFMLLMSSLYGFGQHNANLSKANVMMATQYELAGQFLISLSIGTSKASVALLLLRIMNIKWHKWVIWFWMISMNVLAICLAISLYAQCYPVQALWDSDIAIEACPISIANLAIVTCSWSAAMDFFLAFFPWYVVWELNMKKKDKIIVCVSLSMGVAAGICGIIRTSGLEVLSATSDYLYATADSVMWTSSEQTITIICVCVPSLRPLWQRLGGGSSSGPSGERYAKGYGTGLGSRSFGAQKLGSVNNDATYNSSRRRDEELGDESFSMQTMQPAHQIEISGDTPAWVASDRKSDESILGAGILRKQEVSVTYTPAQ